MSELENWAEDHGYESGTCPRCRARIWTDTGFFECHRCGYSEDKEQEEGKDKDNEDEDV